MLHAAWFSIQRDCAHRLHHLPHMKVKKCRHVHLAHATSANHGNAVSGIFWHSWCDGPLRDIFACPILFRFLVSRIQFDSVLFDSIHLLDLTFSPQNQVGQAPELREQYSFLYGGDWQILCMRIWIFTDSNVCNLHSDDFQMSLEGGEQCNNNQNVTIKSFWSLR